MKMLRLGLVLWCALLAGCISAQQRGERLRSESMAAGVCVIHHRKLEEKNCYGFRGCLLFDSYVYKVHARFPNAVPSGVSEKKTREYSIHEKIVYCEVCDQQASELIRRRFAKKSDE